MQQQIHFFLNLDRFAVKRLVEEVEIGLQIIMWRMATVLFVTLVANLFEIPGLLKGNKSEVRVERNGEDNKVDGVR